MIYPSSSTFFLQGGDTFQASTNAICWILPKYATQVIDTNIFHVVHTHREMALGHAKIFVHQMHICGFFDSMSANEGYFSLGVTPPRVIMTEHIKDSYQCSARHL